MATSKVNSPKITAYFPPSPARDDNTERFTKEG